MTTLNEFYDIWKNDLKFQKDFKENPRKALEKHRLELSPEDLEIALKFKDKSSENDELDKRISK